MSAHLHTNRTKLENNNINLICCVLFLCLDAYLRDISSRHIHTHSQTKIKKKKKKKDPDLIAAAPNYDLTLGVYNYFLGTNDVRDVFLIGNMSAPWTEIADVTVIDDKVSYRVLRDFDIYKNLDFLTVFDRSMENVTFVCAWGREGDSGLTLCFVSLYFTLFFFFYFFCFVLFFITLCFFCVYLFVCFWVVGAVRCH